MGKGKEKLAAEAPKVINELRVAFDHSLSSKESLARAVNVALGCDGTIGSGNDSERCDQSTELVILFDISPDSAETPGGSKNVTICVCSHHSLRESDEFAWLFEDPEVVEGSVRVIDAQDYVDGRFDKAEMVSRDSWSKRGDEKG